MNTNAFLDQLRHEEIVAAIGEAEQRTSGEIRVFVSRKPVADPVPVAQEEFVRMGMANTRERNGVLIFVAPSTNKFAVVGDAGVHEKCGNAFWQELAATMSSHFHEKEFTRGIVHGVRKAGDLLAQFFPRRSDDRNELSDQVSHD